MNSISEGVFFFGFFFGFFLFVGCFLQDVKSSVLRTKEKRIRLRKRD